MSHDSTPPIAVSSTGHEGTGVNTWIIALCGVGVLTLVALGMLVASGFCGIVSQGTPTTDTTRQNAASSINSVPLDPQEKQHRRAYEKAQRERLSTYGWTDRKRGKVRIPIERAMSILVEKQRESE